MWNGIGIGIGRQQFLGSFSGSYSSRVLSDGGTIEALTCVANASTLLQQASLLFIPSGYKAGVAYSALPNNGNGDLTWTRNSTANRTNSSGVISSVGANVPRLSYMYGSCPAALLEPQRTNLCLESENLIAWSTTNASVVSNTNETLDPFGLNNADKISETSVSGNHFIANATMSIVSGTTYTGSVFYKKSASSPDWIQIAFSTLGLAGFANFNLSTGTIGNVGSGCTAQIQSFGNGWYRCSLTQTATASGTSGGPVLVFINNTNSLTRYVNYTGNTNTSIYAFGAQFEAGSYATTYIPTTTASATRIADSFTRSNIYTNGLISASGGTWFIDFRVQSTADRDNSNAIRIGDANNAFNITGPLSGNAFIIAKTVSGSASNILFSTIGANSFVKLVIKWNGSTADIFRNGTKVISSTSFTSTNLPDLVSSFGSPLFIQAMALYNAPISDVDCEILTGTTSYSSFSAMASALGYTVI